MVFFQTNAYNVSRTMRGNPVRFAAGQPSQTPSGNPRRTLAPDGGEPVAHKPSLPRHLSGPYSRFWNPWRQLPVFLEGEDSVRVRRHSQISDDEEGLHGPAIRPAQAGANSGTSTPPDEADPPLSPLARQPRRNAAGPFMPASAPPPPLVPYYGYGWGWFTPPGAEVKLKVTDDYYAGFEPKTTIQKLFGVNRNPAALVIDNPDTLETIWEETGLPESEIPPMDWDKEVFVLVARERSAGTSVIPESMAYSRHNRRLEIKLAEERKPGRNPGVAWYLGKVSNAAPTEAERRQHSDWKKLDNSAWSSFQTVSPD